MGAEEVPTPIVFGSLEAVERQRLEEQRAGGVAPGGVSSSVARGMAAGNIQVSSGETIGLSEAARRDIDAHNDRMMQIDERRRVREIAVPVLVEEVKFALRELGVPITLFGEDPQARRERLQKILVTRQHDEEQHQVAMDEGGQEQEIDTTRELFYTEGSMELFEARKFLAAYSIPRAANRLAAMRRRQADQEEHDEAQRLDVENSLERLTNDVSDVADDRPCSACMFSPCGRFLASAGWSGATRLWPMEDGDELMPKQRLIRTHTDRVTDVVWLPQAGQTAGPNGAWFATASVDRTAKVWSLGGKELQCFTGHLERLARCAMHPSGRYFGTTSFDKTWRLWDVEVGTEVLLQEGHSRGVYTLSFQDDGALAVSGGLDGVCRVWDLRTGKSIYTMEGHAKGVLCSAFSPQGYQIATGGEDNSIRIWNLRQRKQEYMIPSHTNLVSQVRYEPREGYFLVSSSYDNTCKLWSATDYRCLKSLEGHGSKVMAVDCTEMGKRVATASYDRTVRMWSIHEEDPPVEGEADPMLEG